MPEQRVKRKFLVSKVMFAFAAATFFASWARLFPPTLVEKAFSRTLFPTISHIFGVVADALPFSWLDVTILAALLLLLYSVRRREWWFLAGVVSFLYLWFFWTWGLNYHRPPLVQRLQVSLSGVNDS